MSRVSMTPFLRRVLFADAAVSAAAGAVMILGAGMLAPWLQLPEMLLRTAGGLLVPWTALLLVLARQPGVPRWALGMVIATNLVWALECVAMALGVGVAPSRLGQAFLGVQAAAVLCFADLEFMAMRRAPRAAVAV